MTSSFNRLYFIFDGDGIVKSKNSTVSFAPGFAYIIPLNRTNDYISDKIIEQYYIHFRMELYNFKDVFEISDSYLSGPFDVEKLKVLLANADASDWISNMAIKSFIIGTIADLCSPLAKIYPGKMEDAL